MDTAAVSSASEALSSLEVMTTSWVDVCHFVCVGCCGLVNLEAVVVGLARLEVCSSQASQSSSSQKASPSPRLTQGVVGAIVGIAAVPSSSRIDSDLRESWSAVASLPKLRVAMA